MGHHEWFCECECGKTRIVDGNSLKRGSVKSCGCLFFSKNGERSIFGLRRGIRRDNNGYIYIKKPFHPNAQKSGYVLEHVYIMSKILDRPIKKYETIHHKTV